MNKDILEIPIVEDNSSIFTGSHYIVPIYQRAFAWGIGEGIRHNEIIQLMDDVFESTTNIYRLGSLIVARRGNNEFEVIDGQQRLTALYLILSQLGLHIDVGSLSYACRPSAESILENIAKGTFSFGDGVSENDPASGIVAGMRAIEQKIASQSGPNEYKNTLIRKFKQTYLCRIVVPENTDLNRYFEIMNTRGEQLEPQDIVKARLMSSLGNDGEKNAFAIVWDACSDMDGYCQMHFQNTRLRSLLFGNNWTELTNCSLSHDATKRLLKTIEDATSIESSAEASCHTFQELVLSAPSEIQKDQDTEQYSHHESIIDFRHFLLHSLRVFSNNDQVTLNDSNLINAFENQSKNYDGEKGDFARHFICHLLKCRYLFDRYMIKRVYDANGLSEWSLNELVANSECGSSYRKTTFANSEDISSDNENVLMLEACMRVSYLDPKNMHWITQLLKHLVECNTVTTKGVIDLLNGITKNEIQEFLKKPDHANMGVATPHIVFNYLDYLLWIRRIELGKHYNNNDFTKGFAFEYRSSVEHWYPRTPPNGIKWADVNRFGNLCILRGDINSKFSNLMPETKQKDREQYIRSEHQSLKLRIMAKITEKDGWNASTCKQHEEEMLKILGFGENAIQEWGNEQYGNNADKVIAKSKQGSNSSEAL